MRITPGIYQEQVEKAYEVRVVYMNGEILGARLNSQDHLRTITDWRVSLDATVKVEPYKVPHEISEKIIRLMKELDLLFGSLDFIVTPDERYIFLEVNQQGQFLWLEDRNPELKVLDSFCRFIMDPHNFKNSVKSNMEHVSLHELQANGKIDEITSKDKNDCVENPIRPGYLTRRSRNSSGL